MTMNDNELAYLMTLKANKLYPTVSCKYMLPCGICEKTDMVCSHYNRIEIKTKENDKC